MGAAGSARMKRGKNIYYKYQASLENQKSCSRGHQTDLKVPSPQPPMKFLTVQ